MPNNDYSRVDGFVARIKEHIDKGNYDNAMGDLRKIAEHISLWYIYDAGLWDEACSNKDGTQYDRPKLANSIRLLKKNRIISIELRTLLEGIKNLGGDRAAHTVEGDKTDATYFYEKIKNEITDFLNTFPYASDMSSSNSYESLQKAAHGSVSFAAKTAQAEAKPKSISTEPTPIEAKPMPITTKPASISQRSEPYRDKSKTSVSGAPKKGNNQKKRLDSNSPVKKRSEMSKKQDASKSGPLLTASFLEAELAKELLKTQEDYDAED